MWREFAEMGKRALNSLEFLLGKLSIFFPCMLCCIVLRRWWKMNTKMCFLPKGGMSPNMLNWMFTYITQSFNSYQQRWSRFLKNSTNVNWAGCKKRLGLKINSHGKLDLTLLLLPSFSHFALMYLAVHTYYTTSFFSLSVYQE